MGVLSTERSNIEELVSRFALETYGPEFVFRPKQKESIVDTISAWFNGVDNIVFDAPTGSGKSIIAMTVAGVLSKYYGKTGYILISDLSLLKQYENDLKMYFPSWGCLRGQQTYTCNINHYPFNLGACRLKGVRNYVEIESDFPECAPYCQYIQERNKAISAPVTVCTYSLWLLQRNQRREENKGTAEPFEARDFTICDEAHKLMDIVQSHFSPKLSLDDLGELEKIADLTPSMATSSVPIKIKEYGECLFAHTDNDDLAEDIYYFAKNIGDLLVAYHNEVVLPMRNSKKHYSKEDYKLIKYKNWLTDYVCRFVEYDNIIKSTSPNVIVKNDDGRGKKIVFNCLNESYLMSNRFHAKCGKRMYMSATIGDPEAYARDVALSNWNYIKLPVVFDYTNSPIFYVNDYKMSYTMKDENFPRVVEMVEGILNMYPDKKGIIQTGSYDFANTLMQYLPENHKQRMLIYNDTNVKNECLDEYIYSDNKVLAGPSLIEGLSLNDDLCRFQIILKVPYPSLSDKFTVAKMKANPQWYQGAACVSILQGVGRGVRNENDWCVTFILDACFESLFNRSYKMFSDDFVKRIQVIPGSCLMPRQT